MPRMQRGQRPVRQAGLTAYAWDRPAFWWRLAAAYVIVLYVTLPLGRPVVTWTRAHFSTAQQIGFTFVLAAIIGVLFVVWLVRQWRVLSPLAYLAFAVMARLYWHEFQRIVVYPEERLHFLEYGVLSWILLTAFSFHCRGTWPYVFAFFLGSLLGWGDEGVQYLTQYIPNVAALFGCTVSPLTFRRYYEWSDVLLNVLGMAYGLAFLALVVRNRRALPAGT